MPSTLALIEKESPKKESESQLKYLDRVRIDAYLKLRNKKKRTKTEEKEFKEVKSKALGLSAIGSSQIPVFFADEDMKDGVDRVFDELGDHFGMDTPQKKILIHRLVNAWNNAWSYERMFKAMKYGNDEWGNGYTFDGSPDRTKYLAEIRRGMESSNDQIIRLTQALQNLASPPIHVKAKNAIVAQNMQINQGDSSNKKDAKASNRTM